MFCNLTVPHPLWVFVGVRRGKASAFAFTAPRVRGCALGLRLLGLRKDRQGLVDLLWRLTVAVLFPLAPLMGQLPILRGRGRLMGLFHFEEHRRGWAVLHGPEFTDRGRTVQESQCYDFTNTIMRVSVGGNLSSKSQSPFLGVGLYRGLLKFGLLILGLHSDPVGVVPQLVLL